MKILKNSLAFEWDDGNRGKNQKHNVENSEAEEQFFDKDKKIFKDKIHSLGEERYRIIGKTKKDQLLFIVFTIRESKIRIISARNLNRKEVHLYEKAA